MAKAGVMHIFNGRVAMAMLLIQKGAKALTAHAGGGQTSALQLTKGLNQVTIVGTAADSVKLPKCEQGLHVLVSNEDAADAMTVYSKETSGVTINGTAGSTGVSQAAGKVAMYVATSDTTWMRLLSA